MLSFNQKDTGVAETTEPWNFAFCSKAQSSSTSAVEAMETPPRTPLKNKKRGSEELETPPFSKKTRARVLQIPNLQSVVQFASDLAALLSHMTAAIANPDEAETEVAESEVGELDVLDEDQEEPESS